MSQRIPRALVFVCATFILGACSSETGVFGPESAPVEARPAIAPSLSNIDAGKNSKSHGNQSESNGPGRYAMAAN